MSDEFYQKYWIATKKQMRELDLKDKFIVKNAKEFKQRDLAGLSVAGLYTRYSLIVQKIDQCLDQLCHVQKRFTIRKIMDAATIRLNEFKEALTEIDLSEYHYVDGALIELKIIPHQVEILHPSMFYERPPDIEDMWIQIKNGEKIFVVKEELDEEQLNELQAEESATVVTKKKSKPWAKAETESEMELRKIQEQISIFILVIQTAERARQARLYVNQLTELFVLKKNPTRKKSTGPSISSMEQFAINNQRLWRGHCARKYMARKEAERRLLIRMTEPSWKSTKEFDKVRQTILEKRAVLDQHIREYIKAKLDEKARVMRVIAPGLMEDIGDEIRAWFRTWYYEIRNFDKYPPEEKGGTVIVIRGETMTPKQWLDEVEKKRREKAKGKTKADIAKEKAKIKAAEIALKKKEKERLKKELEQERKRQAKGEFKFSLKPSTNQELLQESYKEHFTLWDQRNDVEENPLQKHYMDMITDEKCHEMQLEVRVQVDELMRIELDLLMLALEKDKWKAKGKKGKFKPKKKKGAKKKKKGKKNKDPTANRTTEDLFQELVDNDIIRTYPYAELSQYHGDFSYKNWDLRNMMFDPPPSLGDVRQAVALNCIVPLGVTAMVKPKSVLICGPRQSGKHLLANAIFNHTRCVLFDISPARTAGKYPGKKGMKMLVHLINKLARLLQPSIIFIDGGEKPFYKKVPKQEKQFEPKKMGKVLVKQIVKPIQPQDRILVLAISKEPFNGKPAQMKKAFERIILIPRPDYGSVFMYWHDILLPYHGIDRNINISVYCNISQNYPLPQLKEALETVLNAQRLVQLTYRPLDPHEVLEVLMDMPEPIVDKEWKKYIKWFSKMPLPKRKAIVNKINELAREAEKKKNEKQKK